MACCNAVFERCAPNPADPDNPITVIGILDADAGTTSYFTTDGLPWAGDPATLQSCAGESADICEQIAAMPTTDCSEQLELVTGTCERVPFFGELLPKKVKGSCSTNTVVWTDTDISSAPGLPEPNVSSMNLLDAGGVGTIVSGTMTTPASSVSPLQITVPPATAGCVVAVHVEWTPANQFLSASLGETISLSSQTGDLGPGQIINGDFFWDRSVDSAVVLFDSIGSGAGGNIDLNFPQIDPVDPFAGLVVLWSVHEICGPTLSDFGPAISTTADPSDTRTTSSSPVDMGECDAVYFTGSRHLVTPAQTGNSYAPNEAIAPSNPAVVEVSEHISADTSPECQLGISAGYIPGGSGPVGFDFEHNVDLPFANRTAGLLALPIASCTEVGDKIIKTAECETTASNTNCVEAEQSLDLSGGACISAAPGNHFCVTPVVNGTRLTNQTFSVDNTNGSETVSMCVPMTHRQHLASLAAGATGIVTTCWELTVKEFVSSPDNEIVINSSETTLEISYG